MIKHRIVTDLSECRLLWERFIPQETLWDNWDVRACFHKHFQRPACFIVAEDNQGQAGFLPLSWVEEAGCYQYFPGETWHQATWLEQNRIIANGDAMVQALLEACPGPYHLRYLKANSAASRMQKTVDEISYRFFPQMYGYDLQMYFHEFSGKSAKRLKRELAGLESSGVEYLYDVMPDFDQMIAMNVERFGANSYFHDHRFLESFRSLMQLSRERGWLRLTSLRLGGNLAAIDIGILVNGAYALVGGGTHAEYPGVAKLINMHHLQRTCSERFQVADFLCGDFSWKKLFHLTPCPLYLLSNAAFAATQPTTERISGGVTHGLEGGRVLVIGTTSDYIDIIHRRFPSRVVFVTDPLERERAKEPQPSSAGEVLCPLDQPEEGLARIRRHLTHYGLWASGVACFDCESMPLAAFIANKLSLSYPSAEAIVTCRSKYISKQCWERAGLSCPASRQIETAEQAVQFLGLCRRQKAVLKPLTGSGSELVFVCKTADECILAFDIMRDRLAGQSAARMYAPYEYGGLRVDPRRTVVMEEWVEGPEYSCDFMIDGDKIEVIRIAKKWLQPELTPGTVLAYQLPETVPGMTNGALEQQLRAAAQAVGIDRALCMVDFIMEDNRMVLIEIAPRPGGDCLPPLIRSSCGLDILALALDFAEQRPVSIPPASQWQRRVGLRFFTAQSGVITAIDTDAVSSDPRVLEVSLKRGPGQRVLQPPESFESRMLGYAIFQPSASENIEADCRAIDAKLNVKIAAAKCI